MDWVLNNAAMTALTGDADWRNTLEPSLEMAVALHAGAADDVHAIDIAGRVAWCSVGLSGKAACLGVEVVPGTLRTDRRRALSRAEFFELVPYRPRDDAWLDVRSKAVRKPADAESVVEDGAWVLLVAPQRLDADNPMAGEARLVRVVGMTDGAPAAFEVRAGDVRQVGEYAGWTVRPWPEKWHGVADRLRGRNLYSYQWACKAAGGAAHIAARKAAKDATR